MDIRISLDRLIKDLRTKSALELANLQDDTARYKMEIGSEKLNEVMRDLESSKATITSMCHRFIESHVADTAEDETSAESEIVFTLIGSPRRFDGKEQALASMIHEVLVDLTLQKYYISVSAGDLSKAHEKQATEGLVELYQMLRRKSAPKTIEP